MRHWDKDLSTSYFLGRWAQETPVKEQRKRKREGKEADKGGLYQADHYCGQPELNSAGELRDPVQIMSWSYPNVETKKLEHLSTNSWSVSWLRAASGVWTPWGFCFALHTGLACPHTHRPWAARFALSWLQCVEVHRQRTNRISHGAGPNWVFE